MADWSLIFKLEPCLEISKSCVSSSVTHGFVSTAVGNHMSTFQKAGRLKWIPYFNYHYSKEA